MATVPPQSPAGRPDSRSLPVLVGALLLAAAVAAVTLLRHWLFLSTAYDMAYYAHVVSQISQGEWINTMFGFHVFADHFSPILILLAPLGWWAPAEGLLIVQALAVGSGVIPAYRLGRAIAGNRVGLLAALWFGLSASVWHTVMYDFRPATLGVVAMMWLVAELEGRERPLVVVGLALLAASSREDVAVLAGLILVMHGLLRRRRPALLVGAATGAVGIWYTVAGHRLFAPFDYFLWYRYADYGHSPREVLTNLDSVLATALERIFRDDPLIALAALLIPMLVIPPFLGWKRSWPAFLIFLSNAVSADRLVSSIYYQYYLAAVVFMIWGAVYGFRDERMEIRSRLAAMSTIAIFLVIGPLGIVLAAPEGRSIASILAHRDRVAFVDVLEEIPKGVSVSGGDYLLPHLADRSEIKPFPAPLICSPVLLTYYPMTTYSDYVVVEISDTQASDVDPPSYGYVMTRMEKGVSVWRSSGDHPQPIKCPTIDEARLGLFERVERSVNK